YLDGELIHDATAPDPEKLFVVAGAETRTGELVVKAINSGAEAIPAKINLAGSNRTLARGKAIVLKSANLSDNNSLSEPTRVSPTESSIAASGSTLDHAFPPYSLTVLRLQTR
ncbi:MAG TPA: alpha-L-arabinofuranosidase C-terminal domain-containing protein, partial [Verrucomicrobiae bacterium]|nr:alpha-L-arabinofuranosidase C-terminal domain-containing protein [Verrucomicrobiae bacterium]